MSTKGGVLENLKGWYRYGSSTCPQVELKTFQWGAGKKEKRRAKFLGKNEELQ